MSKLTKFQKYLLAGLSAAGGISLYYLSQSRPRHQVDASWTTNYEPSPMARWDPNWDHRQPESCARPKKANSTIEDDNKYNETLEKLKPKVTRHLLLIRHGQYHLDGNTDKERVLTEIGRKQAFYTGQRLKELQLPYTTLVRSTMTRAQETSSIILKLLQGIKVQDCNFLVEGAPIPPEPSVGNWKPESYQFFEDGARIEAAFRKYFHRESPHEEKDTYTILVCHANVIRYFVCRALQFPPEAWLRFSLNHASITWISISPSGRVLLRTYGDSGHIPVELTSSTKLKNHYDALGVTPKATQNDIKSAYYKMSMVYHPDKNKGSSDAVQKFRDITAAYEVLGNYRLRKLYDKGILHTAGQQYSHKTVEVQVDDEDDDEDAQTKFYKSRLRKKYVDNTYGRTQIYNFDEWSRAHYGQTFARGEKAKETFQRKQRMKVLFAQDAKFEYLFLGVALLITFCLFSTISFERNEDIVKEDSKDNHS